MKGRELDKIVRGTVEKLSYGYSGSLQEKIEQEYGIRVDSEICDVLKVMDDYVGYAPRGKPGISVDTNRERLEIFKVINKAAPDGDVYMGVSLNQDKAKVAWAIDDDNQVVHVEETDLYEKYSRLFDWKRLKDIRLSSLEEYDIPDDLYEEITGERPSQQRSGDRADPTPPEEEELNVSAGRSNRRQKKVQADAIKSIFKNNDTLTVATVAQNVNQLILFPANADRKISDNYWMANTDGDTQTAIAKCNVSTWDYLKDLSQIRHCDEYAEASYNVAFDTSDGKTTIKESADNLVCHIVHDEDQSRFMDVANDMEDVIPEYAESHDYPDMQARGMRFPDDMVYAPITRDQLNDLKPALREEDIMVITGDHSAKDVKTPLFRSDFGLYAYARLKDWPRDCPEFEVIEDMNVALREGGFEFVETLAQAGDPYSQSDWV